MILKLFISFVTIISVILRFSLQKYNKTTIFGVSNLNYCYVGVQTTMYTFSPLMQKLYICVEKSIGVLFSLSAKEKFPSTVNLILTKILSNTV